ncbi:MAG: glycine cleavage system aminomethyltransferase GcvT [Phycisphaeraceae bacterium]|nr:glycine cleavage system aminomethyltransferase GcvT [Phycisphaeraceae bacterium]
MKRTPFYNYHTDHGAKFVDFAGWEMPIHYGSIIDEHNQCRNSGSVFDVSHMGRVRISGRHARKFLETLLTRKVSDMDEGQARYALICNENGGVIDDILVYRFPDDWMMVVNASNREKVLAHMDAVVKQFDYTIKVDDTTESTAMIAVQGPKVMKKIGGFSKTVPTMKNYRFTEKNLMILKMVISRTGYTGEDGVEVILGAKMANMAIKLLLKDKGKGIVKPAGLGARDTLRIEAGMPLYGHELDEHTDPLSAGLKFAVSLNKDKAEEGPAIPRFIGQDALEQIAADGPPKQLIGIKIDGKRTPRQDCEIQADGNAIGTVTSGCMSPTLGLPIAMAYVTPGSVDEGDTVTVKVGSGEVQAAVCKLPFYKRPK